jgi:hypothetical protein
VVVPPVDEAVPDPFVVLPQAARMTTSVANTRILHQVRGLAYEVKKVLYIMLSSLASGDTCNEKESSIIIYLLRLQGCFKTGLDDHCIIFLAL